MNIQKEINKVAANLGMVPGSEKCFDFDGLKFNPREELHERGYEYFIVDEVVLKEGKSGNTRLRLYGRVKEASNEKEIYCEIAPWDLMGDSVLDILKTISE